MADLVIKRGDTASPIIASLYRSDGSLANLAGATVRFKMARRSTALEIRRGAGTFDVLVDEEATPIDNGIARYDFAEDDVAVAGDLVAEFEVAYADGKIETFPSDGYLKIKIIEDIS